MTVTVKYKGTANPYFEIAVTGKQTKWTPGRTADVSDTDGALLVATGLFEVLADQVLPFAFDASGQIRGVRKPDGTVLALPGSSQVIAPIAFSASLLLKTGPTKLYSLVLSSGTGKVTVRDGTNVSGALVSGYGGGGASGLSIGVELTANLPYSPGLGPVDLANGAYLELSGTATGVAFVA